MSELLYLLAAVLLSVFGSLVIWWRHRKPQTFDGNINQFSRGLEALAPEKPVKVRSKSNRPYGRGARRVG